jgi:LysR family nitrogen assimilation transcriptional regulator
LVRVACAGINFMDVHTRQGKYRKSRTYPVRLPCTLGMEGAGTVAALGAGVSHLRIGDRVAWCIEWGSFAEYACIPARRAARIPQRPRARAPRRARASSARGSRDAHPARKLRRMDLRQLRYFVAIVEAGSITDASRRLHVVQPAVSQRLAALEQELGVQLLVRTRSGVTPTAAGSELYARAKSIVKQVSVAEAATREMGGAVGGRVAIGLLRSVARFLAVPLFRELRARHPEIVPEIVVGYSADLVASVDATRLDIALRVAKPGEQGSADVLYTEVLCLVGSQKWLVGKPETIELRDVGQVPLLVSPTQPIHAQLQALAQDSESAFNIVGSIESSEAIEELCCEGHAATFMSETSASRLLRTRPGTLAAVRLAGFERSVSLYAHPDVPKSAAVRACEKTLVDVSRQARAELGIIGK